MSAPIPANIVLPNDNGNTGKKVRTQTRIIGADTVHEHYFILAREQSVLNVFRAALDQQTVLPAAQNGTTAGFLFAHVPSTVVGKAARLRRLAFSSQHSTALATPTAPRLRAVRYTSSGILTGTPVVAAKVDSNKPNPVMVLSMVNTGNTVVHVSAFGSGALVGALTAVGAYEPCMKDIIDPATEEDAWPIFRPGEGFVVYQDTLGTASDTRKFSIVLVWDEIEI